MRFTALLLNLFSFVVISVLVSTVSFAQAPPGGTSEFIPPEPVVDWQKTQDASGQLSALGVGLLGDKIDPHTGGISFEHTDVSLPGNSTLSVSISRRITSGGLYHPSVKAEFGDWEMIAPVERRYFV